jgi:hypothetical protein
MKMRIKDRDRGEKQGQVYVDMETKVRKRDGDPAWSGTEKKLSLGTEKDTKVMNKKIVKIKTKVRNRDRNQTYE